MTRTQRMTLARQNAELRKQAARDRAFILRIAEHLYAAAEVLSHRAEKRTEEVMIECDECLTVFKPMTDSYKCPVCGAENYPEDDDNSGDIWLDAAREVD